MDKENELKEIVENIQQNTKDDIVEYESLGIKFPNSGRETYKCPIYFENEGSDTKTSFMMPGENPYEQALKMNELYYKYRMLCETGDKAIIASQYNACIGEIISIKLLSEFSINARSVTFSGIIGLIRPYVINEFDFIDQQREYQAKRNIYESIMQRIPTSYSSYTPVDNRYNSAIHSTTSLFTVGPNNETKYVNQQEAISKSFEFIQSYSVKLCRFYDNIIADIIMPNIYVDKFADKFIKAIAERPDRYSPGDKQAYVQSILLEQASLDYNKIMELYEFAVMNAFTLFSRLMAPEGTNVDISKLRNTAEELNVPLF